MNLDKLKKGSGVVGDSGHDPKIVPEWMDHERFRKGQQFFVRHLSSATFALHCSLTIGFAVSNLNEPLTFTGMSSTGKASLRRYLKTFVHLALWHIQEDVWSESTLAHKSLQTVRGMHKRVREAMEAKNEGKRRFVSQYDMGVVQVGFIGAILMYPKEFGIKCTKEELEDYVFFWRGIGYLLGIQDEYNICGDGYEAAYRVCKEVENQLVYRSLLDPPPEFAVLSNAYIDGINLLTRSKVFTKEAIIYFLLGMNGRSIPWLRCTWSDYCRAMGYRVYTILFMWMPGFERFFNFLHMRLLTQHSYLIDREFAEFNLCPK